MISYNLSLNERVMDALDRHFARGFTKWPLTHGRGSVDGEPHYGNHAWPAMNASIVTVMPDDKVDSLLNTLRDIDNQAPQHGLRAFVWSVEKEM